MQDFYEPQIYYLLGLMTGRGHIFTNSLTIAIEFSHTNKFAEGIAHCKKCGWLATKQGSGLVCKNNSCKSPVDQSVKKIYEQPRMAFESINNSIIPFLKEVISADYDIIANNSMTLLVIDFKENVRLFDLISKNFNSESSFDRFHIPENVYSTTKENKIEFINGLLDTAGFPSPGGWLNRDGVNGHGRMRVYFQIVRNWHLPVEIDNFLRSEFNLPIHTIDWGHPNIRDANLTDYYESRQTSWSREHQIKFFPEYYDMFSFRISYKQELFNELTQHNKKVVFDKEDDWFPPSKISTSKIKAYHPGESDLRIPEEARKHFDAFWQINLSLGCKYLTSLKGQAVNQDLFALTGDLEVDGDFDEINASFIKIREEKTRAIKNRNSLRSNKKTKLVRENTESRSEQDTYEPLAIFFKKYLSEKYEQNVETFDTSAGNLNLFLEKGKEDLLEKFDYCSQYRIKPDVVGFMSVSHELAFIESKITALDLKSLGQLLGYCLVALPKEAILVSTKKPAISLIKTLKARPELLHYTPTDKMKIAFLSEEDNVEFIDL